MIHTHQAAVCAELMAPCLLFEIAMWFIHALQRGVRGTGPSALWFLHLSPAMKSSSWFSLQPVSSGGILCPQGMVLFHDFGRPNCQRFNDRLDFVFELSSGILSSAPHSHVTECVAKLAMVTNSQRVFPQDLAFASAWLSAELRPRENACPFFSNPRRDPSAYSVLIQN